MIFKTECCYPGCSEVIERDYGDAVFNRRVGRHLSGQERERNARLAVYCQEHEGKPYIDDTVRQRQATA